MGLRLSFQVPEFLRVIWATPEARVTWEPRIAKIAQAWIEIERLAVLDHVKPGVLQVVRPGDLPALTEKCYSEGLYPVVLSRQGVSDGYANGTRSYEEGRDWAYRVFISGSADLAQLFLRLWAEKDDERIGAALGYPECCRDFFCKWWTDKGWRDLTLPMTGLTEPEGTYAVSGPFECNILLRWLGVRLVSHLPCSFRCESSEVNGRTMGLLGIRYGYVKEVDWLTQMLQWPIQWSSLHGIGIVTTPCFKLVFDSTALAGRVTINRDGPVYPTEAARGKDFPFKENQISVIRDEHSDNGFSTAEAMIKAHSVVLEAVLKAYCDGVNVENQKIIDLGCGNGKLLQRILEISPWLVPCGVESDEKRYQKAARRLLRHNPDLHHCNIYDGLYWTPPYGLALLSLNRLREANKSDARELLRRLSRDCEWVVLYSYDNSEWPGHEYSSEFLELISHHADDTSCAILCRGKN